MLRLAPPSAVDAGAWEAPASADDFAEVAAFLVSAVEPGATAARVGVVARLLAMRGYSRAELLLVAHEAPFRPHYGPHIRPDVCDAVVRESRELRARLRSARLSADGVAEACVADSELRPEDFVVCGFDDRNRPLYLHAPEVAAQVAARRAAGEDVPEPTPELPDVSRVLRLEERTGLHDFASIAEQIQAARAEEAQRLADARDAMPSPPPRHAAQAAPRVAVADDPKSGDRAGQDLSREDS